MGSTWIAALTWDAKSICELPDRIPTSFLRCERASAATYCFGLVRFDRRRGSISEHARSRGRSARGSSLRALGIRIKPRRSNGGCGKSRPDFEGRVLRHRQCGIRPLGTHERYQADPCHRRPARGDCRDQWLTLVTRNDRDIAGLGVMLLNPFRTGQISVDRSVGDFRIMHRTAGPNRRAGEPGEIRTHDLCLRRAAT